MARKCNMLVFLLITWLSCAVILCGLHLPALIPCMCWIPDYSIKQHTCEWTSPEPNGTIPGTLEDPDEGSGVHRLGTATR